ncbi:MAG TPA: DNA mismatch repair protein MutS, partial [Leeuwenhoekiella sp.]|nr:DNA mismatch repair protein MutS [Leeuwenhoekiella sp.]
MAKTTKKKSVTPLMKQYNSIKAKYPDALLLFRVGDFYETFGEDAVKAAGILGIILTNRNNGSERTELAGFPHHSLNTYLPKLVKAGCRVAICDQLEDPKQTKSIVKRGVTELVTPGVSLNDEVLHSKSNNFLGAIHYGKRLLGLSFLDVSTGEFLTTQGDVAYIDKLLQNFNPSELLVSKSQKTAFKEDFGTDFHLFFQEDWVFKPDYAHESLNKHFDTKSLKGFGIEHLEEGIIAAGAALHYLSETQHNKLQHISSIGRIAEDAYVWLDRFTIRNLELYQGTSAKAITLLDVIDKTISPMGGRLLKRWLALPLKTLETIKERHAIVEFIINHTDFHEKIATHIKKIGDVERLISKVATGKVSPREIILLKNSLEAMIPVKSLAENADNKALQILGEKINNLEHLRTKIKETINEDAPVNVLKGNSIASGFNQELDELRNLATSGKDYLDKMLERETEQTGITSLKIASNNVFGYYIEVRNTHKDKVPESWIRKQTLVNAERYITDELKEYEAKILGAEERILTIEQQLFAELVTWITQFIEPVQTNAYIIAQLDCLRSYATLAQENNYCRPELDDSFELEITEGRHPVIEKQLPISEPYIANDTYLDRDSQQMIMITGPNMSGKSAILRQTALIVLLAQMGSFVPAQAARIGIVDRIFTRVGASDNISMGESTFMVEMNETASILNNISERS